MNIEYNAAKLQSIIEDFSRITKIDIRVFDKNLNTIALYDHNRSFCHTIQKHKGGVHKCDCSDSEILRKCQLSLEPEVHICHAGLTDIAVPIAKDNTLYGFIILGRIRNTQEFEEIEDRLLWIENARQKLSQSYRNLVCYDKGQINSIKRLVTAITMLILSENIMIAKRNELTENIENYIMQNLDKKLSVNTLCDEFHITKNTLYENFHFSYNMTVGEFITKKRIEKAKKLLAETIIPLADIAQQCGFNSYTYFFKIMKERENTTPKMYRAKYLNK